MKRWLIFGLLTGVISLFCGVGLAMLGISNLGKNATFIQYNGPWRVNPKMDLQNPKQRAFIAKVGLFALRESEVLYFTASVDSEGQPLSSEHNYVIEGVEPEARYWSFTLYGSDNFLIANKERIFGMNQNSLEFGSAVDSDFAMTAQVRRPFKFYIGGGKDVGEGGGDEGENWIPSGSEKQLHLTLRMYNPEPVVYENLTEYALPSIKKLP